MLQAVLDRIPPAQTTATGRSDDNDRRSSSAGRCLKLVSVAETDLKPLGALVMLRTGMKGYVPENILLFVAVDPSARGEGLGSRLVKHAIALCDGNVKLHVEYENPAKRLYERLGFTNKYAEMRYEK